MADKTNLESDAKTIFTNSDGSALTFFMRPCQERVELRPIIESGGGRVTSKASENIIKLAEKGSIVSREGYLSSKYIKDCVKHNKLLEQETYRVKPGTTHQYTDSDEPSYCNVSSDDSMSPAATIQTVPYTKVGRMKYTREEDIAMITYLIETNSCRDAMGKRVWKDMELMKVTNHSAESMNTRYRKYIVSHLSQYRGAVKDSWLKRLGGTAVLQEFSSEALFPEKKTATANGRVIQPLEFEVLKPRQEKQNGSKGSSSGDSKDKEANVDSAAVVSVYKQLSGRNKPDSSNKQNSCDIPRKQTSSKQSAPERVLFESDCRNNLTKNCSGSETKRLQGTKKWVDAVNEQCYVIIEDSEIPDNSTSSSQEDLELSDSCRQNSNENTSQEETGQNLRKKGKTRTKTTNESGHESVEAGRKEAELLSPISNSGLIDSMEDSDFCTQTRSSKTGGQVSNSVPHKSSSTPIRQSVRLRKDTLTSNKENQLSSEKDAGMPAPDFETYLTAIALEKKGSQVKEVSDSQPLCEVSSSSGLNQAASQESSTSEDSLDQLLLSYVKPCPKVDKPSDDCRVTRSRVTDRAVSSVQSLDQSAVTPEDDNTKVDTENAPRPNNKRLRNSNKEGIETLNKKTPQKKRCTESSSDSEPTCTDTDVEECIRACQHIATKLDVPYECVRTSLYKNNGDLERTVKWLKFGEHTPDLPAWNDSDDDELMLTDVGPSSQYLLSKFGRNDVMDRIMFLEGI